MTRVLTGRTRQALLVLDGVLDPDRDPERLALFDQYGNPIVLEGTHGIPPGGDEGQVLGKTGDGDWEIDWIDAGGGAMVPVGGTTGQVLMKASNADGDVEWGDAAGGGAGKSLVDAIQSLGGLNTYLPLQTNLNALVGANATAIGGAAVANDITVPQGVGTKSVSFNGLNQALQVALDLQSPSMTMFFWGYIPSQGDNDNILAELGPGSGEDNSFMLDWTASGGIYLNARGASSYNPIWSFPADHRSEDGWHPYAIVIDRGYLGGAGAGLRIEGYMDGRLDVGVSAGGIGTADYRADTLNIMSRNAASLWTNGKLAHIAIFDRRLFPFEVQYLSMAHLFA